MTKDGSCPTLNAMHGHDVHVVALDGGCLNPHDPQMMRIFSDKGAFHTVAANSGGGMARDGVAYVIGHGGQGGSVMPSEEAQPTLVKDDHKVPMPAVVQCYDMTHADDPGRKVEGSVSPTLQSRMGTGGNQVPLTVSMAQNTRDEVRIVGGDGQIAGALPAEPGMHQQTFVTIAREGVQGE